MMSAGRFRSGRGGLQIHAKPHRFQATYKLLGGPRLAERIEVPLAKVLIGGAIGEDAKRHDQDLVRDRDVSALGAMARFESVVLAPQVHALLTHRRHRRLHESRSQMHVAFATSTAEALAGALVVARADAGPRRKPVLRAEDLHVDANLRNYPSSDVGTDAGDRLQSELLRPI